MPKLLFKLIKQHQYSKRHLSSFYHTQGNFIGGLLECERRLCTDFRGNLGAMANLTLAIGHLSLTLGNWILQLNRKVIGVLSSNRRKEKVFMGNISWNGQRYVISFAYSDTCVNRRDEAERGQEIKKNTFCLTVGKSVRKNNREAWTTISRLLTAENNNCVNGAAIKCVMKSRCRGRLR